MILLFAVLIGFLAGAELASANGGNSVGCLPGLAESRGTTRADRLSPLGGDLYTAHNRRASGGQAAANTNRTSPPGLAARIVGGGLTGACIAAAGSQRVLVGAVLG
jgi:hypothetical protein